MVKKQDRVLKFFSSGKFENPRDMAVLEDIVRYVLFNVALMVGASFLIGFGITVIMGGDPVRGIVDIIIGFLCIFDMFLLRTRIPFVISALIPITPFGILCAGLVMSGGQQGFAGLWVYSYPLIAIFVLGLYTGSILSSLVLAGIMVSTIIPGFAGFNYALPVVFRYIAVYLMVFILTIVYERIRILKDRWVKKLTSELQVERDQITVMKDNLSVGLFLMSKEFVIQGAYSKILENVLGEDELEGKKLTDLLAASVKTKERETLNDYFGMVINRSFDAKMLEDINPIAEFVYINPVTREEKNLRSTFAAVDRGFGDYYILGTFEDITEAKLLQKQLAEEENKREEEMRALFQVIQVEPRVFGDFLEDAEYEFERINDVLKDKKLSAAQAMVHIYQSVHAIKSNAVILGLENFGNKLHELEDKIKDIRDKEDISFEDVLHITVELETIMREKDKFRETVTRLQSFKGGDSRRQDRHVLIETLNKACEKAAAAQNKKVRFIVEDLDGIVLEHGPRRAIKEVLTQLVRNSVYHGIESPREREDRGKNPEGQIKLSIKLVNDTISIKLRDDGRGLDFERIRKKAEGLRLLHRKEDGENKGYLSQVIFSPGFSTAEVADVYAGRGIGLNLVKEKIRDLRGAIKLQTEPGKGTCFNLLIPMPGTEKVDQAS
jgi:two-component system chemotaxis sensor kinase CheA